MTEKVFNRWFNIFILAGMTIVTCLVTWFKLADAAGGSEKAWLLLAAFGSLMGVLATVCSANGWIITFLFGFLDVAIYGVACWVNWRGGGSGLGNAILHFAYFVPMQLVGYLQWRRRGAKASSQVKARRLRPFMRWTWLAITVAATVVLYLILARFDRSFPQGGRAAGCDSAGVQHHRTAPYVDGLHGAVDLLAGGQCHFHRYVAVLRQILCIGLYRQVFLLPDQCP